MESIEQFISVELRVAHLFLGFSSGLNRWNREYASIPRFANRLFGGFSEFANGCKCLKISSSSHCGRVAQLGEHLLCKQGVTGSIPVTSTNLIPALSIIHAAI